MAGYIFGWVWSSRSLMGLKKRAIFSTWTNFAELEDKLTGSGKQKV
jgi:hypothetical protein